MKHLCTILATVFAAAFTASAKTFDWPIDSPAAKAAQFTAYHGETVRFNLRLGGAMTNLSPVAIYYQTNGMGKAEWFGPVPGTVFHPTNDCGAAAYRFFILCNDPDGKDYTANGSLRLLDSPGFEPSAVQLPVRSLDFAKIEVLNPPWGEGPGNYAAVSNAAMSALSRAEAEAGFTEWEYAGLPSDATRISLLLTDNFWQLTFESGGSGYWGMDYSHSSSNDTSLLFICDSELGYPPLQVTVTRTRLPTMTDIVNATNGIPRVAESTYNPGYAANADWADNADFAITANIALDADNAISAEQAKSLHGEQDRPADAIFAQLDAATETNAQQTAAIAAIGPAATNYTESAIANADTSYRRFTTVTNVNQSVQYIVLDASQTSLAIELPSTGETRDWVVYVYAATNAALSLPSGVTWWTSDAANTNAIEAATPTALYFSQISTNILMLGRQTLTEVSP